MSSERVTVREMLLSEVGIRIDYFHNAADLYLKVLGVDRALLPSRPAWYRFYEDDYARPITERKNYNLIWELDDRVVGFSSADTIEIGREAFMHLHIVDPSVRREGLGVEFVRQSAVRYFKVLELQQLFSQPNAFNVAPNRTLQGAGFRYVMTEGIEPSPINPLQPVTRWVIDRDRALSFVD